MRFYSHIIIAACWLTLLAADAPVGAQQMATWTGEGDGVHYSDPNNWDIAAVPLNGGTTFAVNIPSGFSVEFDIIGSSEVAQFLLATNSVLRMNSLTQLTVLYDTDLFGNLIADNGEFTATGANAALLGNQATANAINSGTIAIGGTSYSSTTVEPVFQTKTLFSADGSGTQLDLSALENLNAGYDDSWSGTSVQTIQATNTGVIDLQSLTTITAPVRAEDRLDFVAESGGQILLPNLQQINIGTGNAGKVRFDLEVSSYSLPVLTDSKGAQFELSTNRSVTADLLGSMDDSQVNADTNSHFTAGNLTTVTGSRITLGAGSSLSAASLVNLQSTAVTLQDGGTLTTGVLTNYDDSQFLLSGGSTFSGGATTTSYSSTTVEPVFQTKTLFSADGSGTQLDLSALENLNAGYDDSWSGTSVQTIQATNTGVIDLQSLTTITAPVRAEDRLDFVAESGGQILLPNLQQINIGTGNAGKVRFDLEVSSYSLPALTDSKGASVRTQHQPLGDRRPAGQHGR